eukprot:g21935.t1
MFADNTTVIGQISNNDELEYTKEIEGLVMWCDGNSLSLNVSKTNKLIIDFGKWSGEYAPSYTNEAEVERVETINFLRVMITNNLSWISHIDVTVKKGQQHLFFLRQLRKFEISIRSLTNFYRCTIESILARCITAWYGNCSAQDCKKLQKV